ncbi:hypothetical protein FHR84_000575 [Actinopolyspora biskrensis]|uniref:Glycoside hydrolase 35 catalytic domain-containing protein n=1 Tax=Actinopolyspora biskrensis TaxID=1470178 RepID=A0A852YR93_9ACTN|nr:beta-galactosidase [Actinopolyspora biskrensis]NYH77261.1 hypothetical protein [Actinopolyspora biskrensis]
MSARIHSALVPGAARPIVIGDYPYYRAARDNWSANLTQLRDLGVDVISFYLPWRFHEVGEGTERTFDFHGTTARQRDVAGLVRIAAELDLGILLKPGPFIHAEVQLGGLPDRLCGPDHTAYRGLNGALLTSQARPLPSLVDPAVWAEVETWLRAVADQVVASAARPHGPIVALQLGNEGTCGDVHIPIDAQDASPAARETFGQWLTSHGLAEAAHQSTGDFIDWTGELRRLWSQWSGHAIVGLWDKISSLFPEGPARLANAPLAPACGPNATLDAWAARQRAIKGSPHLVGHTEWVGNPAGELSAFGVHLTEILLGDTDVLESNWGFTWTDESFAEARTPLFNALLALMLGSTTVSVYTACATASWGDLIAMDPDGLTAEGVDPQLHTPPYCPGAPLNESGEQNPTSEGLWLLSRFLDQFGTELLSSQLDKDAVVLMDRTLPEQGAWQRSGQTALQEAAAAVHDQLARTSRLISMTWLDEYEDGMAEAATVSDTLPVGVVHARAASPRIDTETVELVLDPDQPANGAVTDFFAALPGPTKSRWSSAHGRAVALTRTTPSCGAQFLGAFNPTDESDRITGTDGVDWEFELPAGSAAVAVTRGGELLGWVTTPPSSGITSPTITWGSEKVDTTSSAVL